MFLHHQKRYRAHSLLNMAKTLLKSQEFEMLRKGRKKALFWSLYV